VTHALILAVAFALAFTLFDWTFAPWLFGLLGGSGAALERALTFSHVLFTGAVAVWASSFFSALLRGGGDAATPARYGLLASAVYVPLSGILTLGIADWPGFGVAGSAMASLCVASGTTVFRARAIWGGRLGFVPSLAGFHVQQRIFREILSVGVMGSFTTLTATLTSVLMTGLVGRFGVTALAGYGIGARLEFMVAPVAFGIGSGLTTLVGVAAGANAWPRAVRVAWTGGLIAFGTIGLIGWLVVLFPESWSRLFTSDNRVIAASISYITHVAPFYCLFGLGISLNFASQGANRMTTPLIAGFARMITATVGGWIVVEKTQLGLDGVFGAIAAGMIVHGCLIASSLLITPWREREQTS
jgi:MATE family, multidrug efflux pump